MGGWCALRNGAQWVTREEGKDHREAREKQWGPKKRKEKNGWCEGVSKRHRFHSGLGNVLRVWTLVSGWTSQ